MATATFKKLKLSIIFTAIVLFFCLAIGFDITPFLRGPAPYPPEWQWSYQFTNTLSRIWLPFFVGLTIILGSVFLEKRKFFKMKYFSPIFLISICLLTFLVQFSLLYFSRSGVGVLLGRIINPGINGYFTTALSIHNIPYFLATYQSHVVTFPMRAADHPPFAILFFSLILWISSHLPFLFPFIAKISLQHSDIATLWNHLQPYQKVGALLSTIFIPFLSTIVLVPLYFFTKSYYGKQSAIRACFLYAVFPSVYLFLPLNDVFLGIFVMSGFLLAVIGQKRNDYLYFFLSGLSVIIGVFFSISLFVPIGILLLFLYLSKTSLRYIIALLLGACSLPLFLFIFFHFNTPGVFIEITKLQAKRSYLPWLFYDLYDFFIFAGIPILLFSLLRIKDLFEKNKKDLLAIAFFVVLFLLDILGFSRAETGRIWMPYMPLLASIIAVYLTKERKLSINMFGYILVLQVIQLFIMQEFWVTLW